MPIQHVVGFKGEKKSGKSTCSAYLRTFAGSDPRSDIEFSDSMIQIANHALAAGDMRPIQFGNALIDACRVVLDREIPAISQEMRMREGLGVAVELALRDWLDSNRSSGIRLSRSNKDFHRAVLSWIGVNIRDLMGDRVWADEIDRKIELAGDSPLITVGGVRVPVEAEPMKLRGGYVVSITSNRTPEDDDPANSRRHEVIPDCIVHNDGDLNSIEAMMRKLYSDIVARTIEPHYYPS